MFWMSLLESAGPTSPHRARPRGPDFEFTEHGCAWRWSLDVGSGCRCWNLRGRLHLIGLAHAEVTSNSRSMDVLGDGVLMDVLDVVVGICGADFTS